MTLSPEANQFWQWMRKSPSHGVAQEGRVAHDLSRGEKCAITKSPGRGDRIAAKRILLSPLRGSELLIPQPTAGAVYAFNVAAAILAAVEGGILAARIECVNFPEAQVSLTASALIRILSAGQDARLYGRRDACRYAATIGHRSQKLACAGVRAESNPALPFPQVRLSIRSCPTQQL